MDTQKTWDFIVVGGGASGFFGAINLARRGFSVLVLEKFNKYLSKLAISGGGRCNVTHHQFDPKLMISNYPRGDKALLGPFHHFGPKEMIEWLKACGVELKVEADGRMFPTTDSSSTIIDCFIKQAQASGCVLEKGIDVLDIKKNDLFELTTSKGILFSKNILITTGSNKAMWDILKKLGHRIIDPVPSLFALNTPSSPFNELSGLSLKKVNITCDKFEFSGPLLFTHFGLSGPCVLKMSSFAAVHLCQKSYKEKLFIDFCPEHSFKTLEHLLEQGQKTVKQLEFDLPKRLFEKLIELSKIDPHKPLNHIPKTLKKTFIDLLKKTCVLIEGKTTHKDEFVTAGGVDLKEVNFKDMQSKKIPHLYFAGEVLNIDGVTGGFNFQAAWTTSFLAAQGAKPD